MKKGAKNKTKNIRKKKMGVKETKVTTNEEEEEEGEKTNEVAKKMQETIEGQSTVKKNAGAPIADVSYLICESESLYFLLFFFFEYACSFFVYCCCGTVNEEKEENVKEVVNFFRVFYSFELGYVVCLLWYVGSVCGVL